MNSHNRRYVVDAFDIGPEAHLASVDSSDDRPEISLGSTHRAAAGSEINQANAAPLSPP